MPRAAKVDDSVLARVLRDQEGVISRAEALDSGMPLHQVRYRIRAGGPWQRLLPGVYLAATGTPTQQQTEIAALRYAGPGSALTGVAALRRHGVRVWPTVRMPEFVLADGAVRFTQAARAVADASRELSSLREVRAVTADAVQ